MVSPNDLPPLGPFCFRALVTRPTVPRQQLFGCSEKDGTTSAPALDRVFFDLLDYNLPTKSLPHGNRSSLASISVWCEPLLLLDRDRREPSQPSPFGNKSGRQLSRDVVLVFDWRSQRRRIDSVVTEPCANIRQSEPLPAWTFKLVVLKLIVQEFLHASRAEE